MSEPENVVSSNLERELNKQNSILSLTLDEIQSKSGKNLGSMNVDEFLANVWSVEENHSHSQSLFNEPSGEINSMPNNSPCPLTRQTSISVPLLLCNKTVDEVWFDIHNDELQLCNTSNASLTSHALRDMTLEDFLVKAGVVQESARVIRSNNRENVENGIGKNNVTTLGFPINQNVSNTNGFAPYENGKGNENGQIGSSGGSKSRKRIIDGPPELVVERRHRRMIKNRESAARSRARKQAYTAELEFELKQLKEENKKLKKIMAEIEQKKKEKKKMEDRKVAEEMVEKFGTTRRTRSLAW